MPPTQASESRAPNASGDPVSRLQSAMHLNADGTFGPETEAAVKRLQARHGLTVDGVVGPATWSVLGHPIEHPRAYGGIALFSFAFLVVYSLLTSERESLGAPQRQP